MRTHTLTAILAVALISGCSSDSGSSGIDDGSADAGDDAMQIDLGGGEDSTDDDTGLGRPDTDLGESDLGERDLGERDLGEGDLGEGDLGEGDLGEGDLGVDASGPFSAGAFTVQVPSDAGGDQGIATRVFYPSSGAARFGDTAPIVVEVQGGHSPGSLSPEEPRSDLEEDGYILIQMILPGYEARDAGSGGTYDYRGPNCQRALADVIRYALDDLRDADGRTLSERVPNADSANVGVLGLSNGGNLALNTMRRHSDELGDVAWIGLWESPLGDQFVTVDLGSRDGLNPTYVPGTCTTDGCPWPDMSTALKFDRAASFTMTDPVTNARTELRGVFYVDANNNDSMDRDEFTFSGLAGFGEPNSQWYPSVDLADVIYDNASRLFASAAAPPWLASLDDIGDFWNDRDGSLSIAELSRALPDLPVMVLATETDHVQGQPDHPHTLTTMQAFLDADHDFVRLNPDAAYKAALTGQREDVFPDNPANQNAPYPGVDDWLEPEANFGTPNSDQRATIGEMADRVHMNDFSENLSGVLVD